MPSSARFWGSTPVARMPKLELMAQISRPFQIALVALLALAMLMIAWFMVLHRSSGTEASGTSSPSVASSAGGSASHAATHAAGGGSGRVYHGSAPGVEGLTRDIKRAHEAAAEEARGGAYDEKHAGQTHSAPAVVGTHAAVSVPVRSGAQTHTSRTRVPSSASKTHALSSASKTHTASAPHGPAAAAPTKSTSTMQSVVAAELKQGRVALLLFWNHHSSDDVAVDRQVKVVAHKLGHGVAVHTASASQVNSFGSITRDIQVYQTPTLLIVNPKGQVTTLTGYNDAFAIEQAIAEAHGGP
jgi:hypothetical protein